MTESNKTRAAELLQADAAGPAPDERAVAALAYAIYRRRLAQGRPPGVAAHDPACQGEWSRRARQEQVARLSTQWRRLK